MNVYLYLQLTLVHVETNTVPRERAFSSSTPKVMIMVKRLTRTPLHCPRDRESVMDGGSR